MQGRFAAATSSRGHATHQSPPSIFSVAGAAPAIRRGLEQIRDATRADEIITTGQIFDHAARLRSFELAAQAFGAVNGTRDEAVVRQR